MRTDEVTLRPLRAEDFDTLWGSRVRESGGAWRSTPGEDPREQLRRQIEGSGTLVNGVLDLAIERDGRLVGMVQARSPKHGLPPGVFELGIVIFDEADRGRGVGTQAIALMTDRLFEREGAHRAQLSTDVDNAPMRRVVEQLGFAFEGVLRGFMPAPDGALDYAIYGMTRHDWEKTKDTWIQTS